MIVLRDWFYVSWYRYLFANCTGWTNFWCRALNKHKPTWYNPTGFEPDMHCENCGEDLG